MIISLLTGLVLFCLLLAFLGARTWPRRLTYVGLGLLALNPTILVFMLIVGGLYAMPRRRQAVRR